MSRRRLFWFLGLILGVALALAIPSHRSIADLRGLAFGAGLLSLGLLGELLALVEVLRSSRASIVVSDTRPADGQVELALVAGVDREPNAIDPRFSRFVAIDSSPLVAGVDPGRSSPPLMGKVVLVSLFIGRDGRGWSDAEIASAHGSLEKAGSWLEREAMRWQAKVNVALADTYVVAQDDTPDEVAVSFVPEGDDFGPFERDAPTKALIVTSRAAASLGFRDAADLIARINAQVVADVRVWLLHLRRAGRSLAVPLDRTELFGVSLAICYARESSFPEPLTGSPAPDSATIAHEMLHLFGASDKYGRALDAFPRRSVTERDIMRLRYDTLAHLRIDPLTASEIGWGENVPGRKVKTGPSGAKRGGAEGSRAGRGEV